jgi:hypothetical protein
MVSKLRLKKRNAIGESFLANPVMVPRSAVGVFDPHENILKKHRIWVYIYVYIYMVYGTVDITIVNGVSN